MFSAELLDVVYSVFLCILLVKNNFLKQNLKKPIMGIKAHEIEF